MYDNLKYKITNLEAVPTFRIYGTSQSHSWYERQAKKDLQAADLYCFAAIQPGRKPRSLQPSKLAEILSKSTEFMQEDGIGSKKGKMY